MACLVMNYHFGRKRPRIERAGWGCASSLLGCKDLAVYLLETTAKSAYHYHGAKRRVYKYSLSNSLPPEKGSHMSPPIKQLACWGFPSPSTHMTCQLPRRPVSEILGVQLANSWAGQECSRSATP